MSPATPSTEPFVDRIGTRLVEAGPARAVVVQPQTAEIENHLGLRHASALHAAAYEASRGLVRAAVECVAERVTAELLKTEISYAAIAGGTLTSTAQPCGSWHALLGDLGTGLAVTVDADVLTVDDDGRTVARMVATWRLAPAG